MKIERIFLFFAALALLALAAPNTSRAFLQGEKVPDIELETIDGTPFQLYDQKGEAILLKLGATWCPECQQQSWQINQAHEFLAANDIPYIEVFLQDSEHSVRDLLAKSNHHLTPTVILDEGQIRRSYNVFMIPRLLILDSDFRVVYDGGLLEAKELVALLEKSGL